MKIVWSEEAILSYEKTIDFILERWNSTILTSFMAKVNTLLNKLSNHSKLCPKSLKMDLRKCIVSEQTSLVYRIKNDNLIEIVLFVDNRSKHNY